MKMTFAKVEFGGGADEMLACTEAIDQDIIIGPATANSENTTGSRITESLT